MPFSAKQNWLCRWILKTAGSGATDEGKTVEKSEPISQEKPAEAKTEATSEEKPVEAKTVEKEVKAKDVEKSEPKVDSKKEAPKKELATAKN